MGQCQRAKHVVGASVSTATAPRRSTLLPLTEITLFLATASAVFGLVRIFIGYGFLKALLVGAVGSHLLAVLARRSRLPLFPAALLSLLGGAITLGLMFYRNTMWFGLPTRATWDTAFAEVRASVSLFATSVPPVRAEGGYFLAAAVATWVLAFVADSIAYRAKASIEAALPSGVLFVFASALASQRMRVASTMFWLGSVLVFVVLHRTMKEVQSSGWLSGHRRGASVAFVKGGVLLGGFATLFGAFAGPHLPGADKKAIVHTRNAGSSDVYQLSPFVNIKKQVASRSTDELFTVKSDVKSYWRATSLPDFDGTQWSSGLRQGSAKGSLGQPNPGIPQKAITASFTIGALRDIWVPAPYLPTALNKPVMKAKTKFDRETATLMAPGDLQKGDSYEIVAEVSDVTPAILQSASPPVSMNKRYLKLPENYPADLVDQAQEVTKDATTQYDKAKALQDWFQQNFTYSLDAPSGETTNDIQNFLNSRSGFCQQFSGTFAAFARSIGIPSRVAIGFTPGILKADGLYHVQALHAHAWPEVYFEGVGWLAFEPTPGRGNPTAEAYTGVQQQQAGEDPVPVTTTIAPPSTIPVNSTPATTAFRIPKEVESTPVAKPKTSIWKRYRTALIGLTVLALIGLYPFALRRTDQARWTRRRKQAGLEPDQPAASGRRGKQVGLETEELTVSLQGTTGVLRRRKQAGREADQLAVSWHRTIDVLRRHDMALELGETPLAFADRATRHLRMPAEWLPGLADVVTRSTYAGHVPTDTQLRDAERIPLQTRTMLQQRLTKRQQLIFILDPRPLFRALPGDTPKQRRFG